MRGIKTDSPFTDSVIIWISIRFFWRPVIRRWVPWQNIKITVKISRILLGESHVVSSKTKFHWLSSSNNQSAVHVDGWRILSIVHSFQKWIRCWTFLVTKKKTKIPVITGPDRPVSNRGKSLDCRSKRGRQTNSNILFIILETTY